VRRLLDEERERLVERRQVGRDLSERLQREATDAARRGAVADLVEVVRVGEDERAAPEVEDVELDHVDAGLDRGAKRRQGVLRRERGRASMADPKHAAERTVELDHAGLPGTTLDEGPFRSRRSHQPEPAATRIAWATTIAEVSLDVSCQNSCG
jgi:hypothetical protein